MLYDVNLQIVVNKEFDLTISGRKWFNYILESNSIMPGKSLIICLKFIFLNHQYSNGGQYLVVSTTNYIDADWAL